MSVEKNVPQIRFKGFNEEWAEKNLGEIGSLKNGMNFDKAAMGHGHPFVNLQDVFGKNEVNSENLGLAYSTENQRKDYSLNEGDVLFIRSSVKPEGVGEAAVVPKKMENTTYSGFIIRFRPGVEMDVNFNRFVYSTTNSRKQILASSTSSANSNINQDSLQRIQLALPCKPEQTQIGNYFQKIDNLINQHQQKHDKLSSIKKAMLGKMFPKQGETVPEIRFKGFDGEWVEKEFSDIATRVSTQHQSTYLPCVEYEDIVAGKGRFNKDIHQKKIVKAGLKFEVDDVLFGKLRPYLKNWFLADFEGIAVGDFWVLRADNVTSTFLFYLIQTNKFEFISNLSAGSKMPRSDWGLVSSSCFYVPNDISESKNIGNYFQKLDTLINQHQQQITKLNNIKQACLSKMFV